jgi:predicted Zn-dependent protease
MINFSPRICRHTCLASFLVLLHAVAGCAVNPVTGKRDLILVSEEQELAMGEQAYAPTQQSQGGIYDVDPELTAYISEVGQRLAAQSDRQLPYEFVVLNNSVPNAWALPGGKIAINRGLLTELESEAELAAVLGHEIVHAAARHSAQQVSRGMLSQVLVVATAVIASDSDYGSLAVGGAGIGAQLINSRYGRDAELESDRYGMIYMSRAGYDPQGAVSLQETFVRLNDGHETDWINGLFASHPPSTERVQANRAMAAELPAGGELGEERYQRHLARTRELEPAYTAYEEGRAALGEGDAELAMQKADAALATFSGEANFHALKGDVYLERENYPAAIDAYSKAVDLRGSFFYYPLQRGLVHKRLGDLDAAVRDLERSSALMPTAPAEFALGQIAEERGDIDAAIEHYTVVARAGGDYGKAAQQSIARIQLPDHPGNYFAVRCATDRSGNLLVAVQNRAGVATSNIVVAVDFMGGDGRERRLSRELQGPLAPDEVGQVATGLGPYTGTSCPASVVSARVAGN